MEKENIKHLVAYMNKANYPQTDIQYIENAYETARRLHEKALNGVASDQLEYQCIHLIHTAFILAEIHLDANTIASALMHDIFYTCEVKSTDLYPHFSKTVIQYLEDMKDFHDETMKYLKGNTTLSRQDLLNKHVDDHVIMISAAKRIDRLRGFRYIRKEERPYYLDNTNELLIKLVEKEGAIYLFDLLYECWLRCNWSYSDNDSEVDVYKYYDEKYKRLLRVNEQSTKASLYTLKCAFNGTAKGMPTNTIKHTKNIQEVVISKRLISSIYRHIQRELPSVRLQTLSKWNVPLFDITIIFDDVLESTRLLIDDFMFIFNYYLKEQLFLIKDYLLTKDGMPYFIISDQWENRYRIFLRTKFFFRRYQIGAIANEEYNNRMPPYSDGNKGKVHIVINNKVDYLMPGGYSSLDYAFMFNDYSGLTFEKMIINNMLCDTIGKNVLQNGDVGILFFSNHVTAELSWFKYVETKEAKEQLIEYFNNKYVLPHN